MSAEDQAPVEEYHENPLVLQEDDDDEEIQEQAYEDDADHSSHETQGTQTPFTEEEERIDVVDLVDVVVHDTLQGDGNTIPSTPMIAPIESCHEEQVELQEIVLDHEALTEIKEQLNTQLSSSRPPSNKSSYHGSERGSQQGSKQASKAPSVQPSTQASKQPSVQPSLQPSIQPSVQSSVRSSRVPSEQASKTPSVQPSTQVSRGPSVLPSVAPSAAPSVRATPLPSAVPSVQPSAAPSVRASPAHSSAPSVAPSRRPSTSSLSGLHPVPEEPPTLPELPPINIVTTRNRRKDRSNLANDILAELPISIRFNDSMFLDQSEDVVNYQLEWERWTSSGLDQLEVLLEAITVEELKFKSQAKFNHNCARAIQGALMVMGSAIVYLQASGSSADVINRFTVASGAGTTVASFLLNFVGFAKKAPHFATIYSNLSKLRCWIETKLVLPVDRRFSPYDIYSISKIAYDTIIHMAQAGLQESK